MSLACRAGRGPPQFLGCLPSCRAPHGVQWIFRLPRTESQQRGAAGTTADGKGTRPRNSPRQPSPASSDHRTPDTTYRSCYPQDAERCLMFPNVGRGSRLAFWCVTEHPVSHLFEVGDLQTESVSDKGRVARSPWGGALPSAHDACGQVGLQSAHRLQLGLQPSVITAASARCEAGAVVKDRLAEAVFLRLGTSTSMTSPCWSTA